MKFKGTSEEVIRIRIITGLIFVLGLIFLSRLYYLQIMRHEHYLAVAESQYVNTVQNFYNRGSIFLTTKDGVEVAGAAIKQGHVLAINPNTITDAELAYEFLSSVITLDRDWFMERTTWKNRTYIEIATITESEIVEKIRNQKLSGVSLYKQQWRYYPGKDMSARTFGFVGYTDKDPNYLRGVYGLERFYDDTLTDKGEERSVNFFAEIFNAVTLQEKSTSTKVSGDIVTTIEPTVARILDKILTETNDKYKSAVTGGIVMDPKTGAIYAMNSVPTFDLNNRTNVDVSQFRNPMVENVYEMGSVIKALTVAAGLDSKVITPYSTYYDAGFLELDTFTIRNYDGKGRGMVDMQAVLNQSLNTGVSHIMKEMGREKFRNYFTSLQLGSETGIDLPSEASGLVSNLNSPRQVEYATASFGQGIAMTPISTVRALSALGNGGYLVTPHLVSNIKYKDGTERKIQYPNGKQVWSPETSETVSRMLVKVVDEALRGGKVALPNHTIAAKTGTAQIADPAGGYYDDRYLHSFFGYFPAYDPKFIVFMFTVEPKGIEYASETLTDPFMEMTKFLINYYSIPPDR